MRDIQNLDLEEGTLLLDLLANAVQYNSEFRQQTIEVIELYLINNYSNELDDMYQDVVKLIDKLKI